MKILLILIIILEINIIKTLKNNSLSLNDNSLKENSLKDDNLNNLKISKDSLKILKDSLKILNNTKIIQNLCLGACCSVSSCIIQTKESCPFTYKGDNSDCSTCGTSSCCQLDGTCINIISQLCTGIPGPPNSICSSNSCVGFGACCKGFIIFYI